MSAASNFSTRNSRRSAEAIPHGRTNANSVKLLTQFALHLFAAGPNFLQCRFDLLRRLAGLLRFVLDLVLLSSSNAGAVLISASVVCFGFDFIRVLLDLRRVVAV